MARKNDKTTPKPSVRQVAGKGKPKPKRKTTSRGGKRPKTPADDDLVSRASRVRSSSRGGRGR